MQREQARPRSASSRCAKSSPTEATAERCSLQIEIGGGPLDIGEGVGIDLHEPLKFVPCDQGVFELAVQFLGVVVDCSIEGDQIPVKIVDDFGPRGLLGKEVVSRSGEHLDIALVFRKFGNDDYLLMNSN